MILYVYTCPGTLVIHTTRDLEQRETKVATQNLKTAKIVIMTTSQQKL